MASAAQLKALLKSYLDGDDAQFFSITMQLAAHEAKLGHGKLLVKNTATASRYTRPKSGFDSALNITPRNRDAHAKLLVRKLKKIQEDETGILDTQKVFGLDAGNGIYLSFESDTDFDLKFESLEFQPSGIELRSVKRMDAWDRDRTGAAQLCCNISCA